MPTCKISSENSKRTVENRIKFTEKTFADTQLIEFNVSCQENKSEDKQLHWLLIDYFITSTRNGPHWTTKN